MLVVWSVVAAARAGGSGVVPNVVVVVVTVLQLVSMLQLLFTSIFMESEEAEGMETTVAFCNNGTVRALCGTPESGAVDGFFTDRLSIFVGGMAYCVTRTLLIIIAPSVHDATSLPAERFPTFRIGDDRDWAATATDATVPVGDGFESILLFTSVGSGWRSGQP